MGQLRIWQAVPFIIGLLLVVSCGSGEEESPATNPEAPTPTTHPNFWRRIK